MRRYKCEQLREAKARERDSADAKMKKFPNKNIRHPSAKSSRNIEAGMDGIRKSERLRIKNKRRRVVSLSSNQAGVAGIRKSARTKMPPRPWWKTFSKDEAGGN